MKYYIGIDLGGTNIAIGICNKNYKIVHKDSIKTDRKGGSHKICNDMATLILKMLDDANINKEDVASIGIGSPGTVDPVKGIVEFASNLNFTNEPIVQILEDILGIPTHIENDANAATYGEYIAGAAKGASSVIMITLGTGIGGGMIINDKLFSGHTYAGAEFGHMVIVKDGRYCTCGRYGCYEAYASVSALIGITIEKMLINKNSLLWDVAKGNIKNVSGKTAFDAMRLGDETAAKIVNEYISNIACGVTNLVHIFQPEVLLIGGGISKEGDTLINPIKELVDKEKYSKKESNDTKILAAKLGNDAGIIGAAFLGQEI